jgi:hypothetical protein
MFVWQQNRYFWHAWAVANYRVVAHYAQQEAQTDLTNEGNALGTPLESKDLQPAVEEKTEASESAERIKEHVTLAIEAFFRSISLEKKKSGTKQFHELRLQDTLRLLNLWFKYVCVCVSVSVFFI